MLNVIKLMQMAPLMTNSLFMLTFNLDSEQKELDRLKLTTKSLKINLKNKTIKSFHVVPSDLDLKAVEKIIRNCKSIRLDFHNSKGDITNYHIIEGSFVDHNLVLDYSSNDILTQELTFAFSTLNKFE